MDPVVEQLLASEEPSIRYKVRVHVLGEDPAGRKIRALQEEIRQSPRVQTLLAGRQEDGRLAPRSVYSKWIGAHWVLTSLADIGYPAKDASLQPAMDPVLDCWLEPRYLHEFECQKAPTSWKGVPILNGRARRCASQQGNALFSAVRLGFVDKRVAQLAECLIRWQWPDGGWNCDRDKAAVNSSFWETLTPLRGLVAYAKATGDAKSKAAWARAAEVFLKRHLYRRCRDGKVMNPQFLRLHYPCYWRYDILFGLKVMAEAGLIGDRRCSEALDLLESKQLAGGGWAAEERFYQASARRGTGQERVDWGPVGRKRMNDWVTADALAVLKAAGRLKP